MLCLLHELTFYNIGKIQVKNMGNQKCIFFCHLQSKVETLEFLLLCLHFHPIIRDCYLDCFFAFFTVNLWRIFLGFKPFFIIISLKF